MTPPHGDCPGPGEHQNLDRRDGFYNMKGEQSVRGFRSTLPRFPRDPAGPSQGPPPGTYEAFDKVNYRNKFRRAKNEHLSFGSGGSRWNPNEVFVGQKHSLHPGPGEYSPRLTVSNVALGNIGSTSRDLSALPQTGVSPGPGQYDTHGTTMHLMSYNTSGPEAARRAQGYYQSTMEPLNIGGGAGGGISGTRSRLGQSSGGAGVNAAAIDNAVRERGKARHVGSTSEIQSGTSSPKGARISASEGNLSPSMKDAVGTAFVTEPIALAKGWTAVKGTSSVQQATPQPEELGQQEEKQQQSAPNTTSEQPVTENAVVAEEVQSRAVEGTSNSIDDKAVASTGDTNGVDKAESETVVAAVETSQ